MKWIVPEVIGKAPCARFGHSMVSNKSLNILVIFGGLDDNEKKYLNDLFILDLSNLQWVQVI